MPLTILIADADPVHRRILEAMVNRFGYRAEVLDRGSAVLDRLDGAAAAGEPAIDLLILDLALPGLDAIDVLAALDERGREIPAIVQAANRAIDTVLSAMRAGARDFIVKPVSAERLQVSIKNALRLGALEAEVRRLGRHATGCLPFTDIAGESAALDRVVRLGQRAAKSTIPVLLEGEAGTGKEVIARAIHGTSDRRGRPFVSVSCGALPDPLALSILFGHEKGAFEGADEKYAGKLVEARGGTLFLDEIGELPHEAQIRLLHALQTGEVTSVGAKRGVKIDIRPIFATSRNLIELVKRGRLREDLYYRLNVFPIGIPPLRARRDDIGALARRFCARFAAEEGRRLRGIGAEALALLSRYDWPGNVRQLENAVYRAVVLAETDELTVAEFPQIAARVEDFDIRIPPAPLPVAAHRQSEKEFIRVEMRDPNVLPLLDETGRMRKLDQIEADAIRFALAHYHGHMSAVARGLEIGRSTLYRKMKDHGLQPPDREATNPCPSETGDQGIDGAAA